MAATRRNFMAEAAFLTTVGAARLSSRASAAEEEKRLAEDADAFYKVYPIGKVTKRDALTQIYIFDEYVDGLLGLDQWSHVNVFYWFDKNDLPARRRILQVHPRGDRENPITGVFACRAPVRPNLIALSVCRILAVDKNLLTVDGIDAFDETPVLDLKPFIPPDAPTGKIKVPDWTRRTPRSE